MEKIALKICGFLTWLMILTYAVVFIAQRTATTCLKDTNACTTIAAAFKS